MIVQLDDVHLPQLVAHIARHSRESGRGGDLIFRPRSSDAPIDESAAVERHRAGWAMAIDEPYWLRTWGVVVDRQIRGHLDLHGGRLPSEFHRALLGAAIGWARAAGLTWLDLGVFAHNDRARKLYASVGFVELGTTRDRYRVDDVVIDDVAMALEL